MAIDRIELARRMRERELAYGVVHEHLIRMGYVKSCLNCDHWDHEAGTQCLKYKAVPPPKVIVYGCPDWTEHIPF